MKLRGKAVMVGIVMALLCALPVAPATATEESCAAEYETVRLITLHVVLKTAKKVYEIGDVVPVEVEVTRPAHEDPVGQDQPIDPPLSEPAQNVLVGLGLNVGRTYLFGIGTTDDEGKTTINVPLPEYVPPGRVFGRSLAWNKLLDTTCLIVEEQGYAERTNFFTVKR